MKLWQKKTDSSLEVTRFTVGADKDMDMYMASFDVLGSLAHITMLQSINLITLSELDSLSSELKKIYREIESGNFSIQENVEDVHSQIELILTQRLGEVGKKIHSGRSRNDQVLLDIKLFVRHELEGLTVEIKKLFDLLLTLSEKHREDLLPGYTHMQLAMPSSFGLWFGAYAESLADDLIPLLSAYQITNKNPLGSAAGYGSSFPLKRKMTTELLGFDDLNYNVVYAQMGRGKTERIVASALSNVASTLARLAMDACVYLNPNFGFISFPENLTTGSSIMPHKKNPDVFELIRGKCNSIAALPNEITIITANLPSGYHRDVQLLKEKLFPAFQTLKDCIQMTHMMLAHVVIRKNLLEDEKYKYLFSVEEVNRLVLAGMPFRDAYRKVGMDIESGNFTPPGNINHTHEGSIGNLCNHEIRAAMENTLSRFPFAKVNVALENLLK